MVFKGQTLVLTLDTDTSLSGYTGYIVYEKPNGVTGTWSGSVVSDTVSKDIDTDDIDVAGVWKVQAKAVNGDDIKWGKIQVVEFRNHL